jgi:glycosyltransferase involved in cell wall biosynthesis
MSVTTKKLIYILNHYSPDSTQHFYHVINLLEEISLQGVEVNLIIEKAEVAPIIANSNIKIFLLHNKGLKRLPELYRLISKFQRQGFKKVFVRISNFGACVAIVNSFFKKLDVYYWHSGTIFGFDNGQRLSITKLKWYLKTRLPFNFIKAFVTYFVTGPESMRDYYVKVVGVADNKIRILYNDINTSRFKLLPLEEKQKLKSELGLMKHDKIVLFVHKFSPVRKSGFYIKTFIEMFFANQALHEFKFCFIGDGKDLPHIQAQIAELDLTKRIKFLGALPNSVVHKYYQIADIFINPTHAEGFPRVLIEAMACGLPIVTTNAGGIADILGESQKPFMSDINDANGFARNLVSMALISPDTKEIIISENLDRIKKYRTENVAAMYISTLFNE